ncbi:MAG: hypothetical protein FD147_2533 [Chloroflexi bacterium]|nr:MAG: hypothetical protein FD147_2533 [Chloroflexota bacterium]
MKKVTRNIVTNNLENEWVHNFYDYRLFFNFENETT